MTIKIVLDNMTVDAVSTLNITNMLYNGNALYICGTLTSGGNVLYTIDSASGAIINKIVISALAPIYMKVNGNFLFIVCGDTIEIYSITDTYNPQHIISIVAVTTTKQAIMDDNGFLFIFGNTSHLVVYDFSTYPLSYQILDDINTIYSPTDVFFSIYENRLYLYSPRSTTITNILIIYDISAKNAILELSHTYSLQAATTIIAIGDYIFFGSNSVYIYDITGDLPIFFGSLTTTNGPLFSSILNFSTSFLFLTDYNNSYVYSLDIQNMNLLALNYLYDDSVNNLFGPMAAINYDGTKFSAGTYGGLFPISYNFDLYGVKPTKQPFQRIINLSRYLTFNGQPN